MGSLSRLDARQKGPLTDGKTSLHQLKLSEDEKPRALQNPTAHRH